MIVYFCLNVRFKLIFCDLILGLYTSKKDGNNHTWYSGTIGEESCLSELLSKALSYVTKCIALCHKGHQKPSHYIRLLEPARVSLAYIWMELNNPAPVTRLADLVLGEPLPEDDDEKKMESQGLRATIRMYACEAMSLMGNPKGGLKYLSSDNADVVAGFLSEGTKQVHDNDYLKTSVNRTVESLSRTLRTGKDQ